MKVAIAVAAHSRTRELRKVFTSARFDFYLDYEDNQRFLAAI
jgi:hypothetical protein